jgi:Flp pilus assembly protein CpaB
MKTRLIGAILAVLLTIGGTVLLSGYVRGADLRAARGAELVHAYIVHTTIPEGTVAAEVSNYVSEDQIPAGVAVADRVASLAELTGLVAGTTLLPGEQLLTARWVDPAQHTPGLIALPQGMQAISLALPVERVAGGLIVAGDTVGVVIAGLRQLSPDAAETPVSQQVFQGVLVLGVTDDSDGATVLVTLAQTTSDIERLVWGQQFGTVWLTRESSTADDTLSSLVDAAAVFR